jgi:phospholipase D1/2
MDSAPGSFRLFEENRNCWWAGEAAHASVIVDCGNYYRDLYESLRRARHSIFILGWDIDSRIELLRGEDARQAADPINLFDLLQKKAAENPRLEIYLNRWSYSLIFVKERESFSDLKWRLRSPPNIHYCEDAVIPVGACHHQKIVVVDDEVAYCGGMDVAIGRWDFREHHVHNADRVDPAGTLRPRHSVAYGPYHDIQAVVSGAAARKFGELARRRWRLAAGYDPVPLRSVAPGGLPASWPPADPPQLEKVRSAITLTEPGLYGAPANREVEQMYLDMVAAAQDFIYIENQFVAYSPLAEALNKRLREKPGLRVLILSCFDPEGVFEKKAMWTARAEFRDLMTAGGVETRAAIAYPVSAEQGVTRPVRIHSKVMIVDDRYLRVGSSNINIRSMGLDTECDLVIEGGDSLSRAAIAAIRNDLIREHTGFEAAHIGQLIAAGRPVGDFLRPREGSRQHLLPVDDEKYREEKFAGTARALADPAVPILPEDLTLPYRYPGLSRRIAPYLLPVLFFLLLACLALVWKYTPLSVYAAPEKLAPLLQHPAAAGWAIVIVIAIMALAGFLFFPLIVMTAAAAAAFGPMAGFTLSLASALITAALGFLMGRWLGRRFLRVLFGPVSERIAFYARRGGVIGMTILRMTPIAPFNAINIALGISGASFSVYMAGTLLGLLPGMLILSFAGHSLAQLWIRPSAAGLLYAATAAAVWVAGLVAVHMLVRRWQKDIFPEGRR